MSVETCIIMIYLVDLQVNEYSFTYFTGTSLATHSNTLSHTSIYAFEFMLFDYTLNWIIFFFLEVCQYREKVAVSEGSK